ncbi:MAG: branched-chain amino acid ABC transporter permease [Hyphomicrobiales bacterium]|nr:branched-chain amino acid ABC transporter permease [Hyphomicrobiales bacterium]
MSAMSENPPVHHLGVARSPLQRAVRLGLIFGAIAVYIAVVGILPLIDARWIVVDVISLGDAALIAIGLGAGAAVAARRPLGDEGGFLPLATQALLAGAVAGGTLALLAIAMSLLDLRPIFIALSPVLLETLTFGLGVPLGSVILIVSGAVLAVLGAALSLGPVTVRQPVLIGLAFVLFFGVFQELIQIMLQFGELIGDLRETLYTWEGLSPTGAVIIFVLSAGGAYLWTKSLRAKLHERMDLLSPAQHAHVRTLKIILGIVLVVLVPIIAGPYIGQVMMLVGLYVLMGMGLNLEVGLAGLLDLGFVAFFAVGAYTTALLTADSPHALAAWTSIPSLSYWAAMPIAVLCSVIVGILFGIPVLGVRGDYLAVATMGLGEIVRVIVQSDMAAPLLAGAQGILQIPKPRLGNIELSDPVSLFYLTLVCSAVAAYFAWRLENSRLGRAWMAVRDDEDVAQALGINLVKVKLLAYGLGAAFAGLAGSIFAVMLTSIYPSSFQLLISINVLALIIVGGMGSLPGVVVGAIALVGLPELLREFGEYRYLFYGAALIIMMRIKPEGLWPSATRQRELRAAAGELEPDAPSAVAAGVETPSFAAQGLEK